MNLINFKEYVLGIEDYYNFDDYYFITKHIKILNERYHKLKTKETLTTTDEDEKNTILNKMKMLILFISNVVWGEYPEEVIHYESDITNTGICLNKDTKKVVFFPEKLHSDDDYTLYLDYFYEYVYLYLYEFTTKSDLNRSLRPEFDGFPDLLSDVLGDNEFIKILYDNSIKNPVNKYCIGFNSLLTLIILIAKYHGDASYVLELMKKDGTYDKFHYEYLIKDEKPCVYNDNIAKIDGIIMDSFESKNDKTNIIEWNYYHITENYFLLKKLVEDDEAFECTITKGFFNDLEFGLNNFKNKCILINVLQKRPRPNYISRIISDDFIDEILNMTKLAIYRALKFRDCYKTISQFLKDLDEEVEIDLLHLDRQDCYNKYISTLKEIKKYIVSNTDNEDIKNFISYEMEYTLNKN